MSAEEAISITEFHRVIFDLVGNVRRDVQTLCSDSNWREIWALDPLRWDVNEAKKTLAARFNSEINVLTLSNKRAQIDLYLVPEYINKHEPSKGVCCTTVQFGLAFQTHGTVFLRELGTPVFQSLSVVNDKFLNENVLRMKVITKDAAEVIAERAQKQAFLYQNVANVLISELEFNCVSSDLRAFLKRGAIGKPRVFVSRVPLNIIDRLSEIGYEPSERRERNDLDKVLRDLRNGLVAMTRTSNGFGLGTFKFKWDEQFPSSITITKLEQ